MAISLVAVAFTLEVYRSDSFGATVAIVMESDLLESAYGGVEELLKIKNRRSGFVGWYGN